MVRSLAVLLVGVSMLSLVAAQSWTDMGNNSWSLTTGDVTLTVSSLGGRLSLQRSGASQSVFVALDRLSEIDSTGTLVWKVDLNNVLFGWSIPTLETVNGASAIRMDVNATIKSTLPPNPNNTTPHKLFMTVFLYQENGTVTFGNNTYTVAKDNAKFSLRVSNWEWRVAGNRLQADFALGVNGQQYQPAAVAPKPGAPADVSSCDLNGVGAIDVVTSAIADGADVTVTAATYGGGGRSGVSIFYPYFASELEYDPTLSVGSSSESSSAGDMTSMTGMTSVTSMTSTGSTTGTTSDGVGRSSVSVLAVAGAALLAAVAAKAL